MRSLLLWALAFAAIAGYIGMLVRTSEPEVVDPDSVGVTELKTLMSENLVPSGYALVAENGGRQPWGMPGDTWRATYAERLFQDAAGSRIAVRINVTGTPRRGSYVGSYDALCSQAWADSDCNPQYNANRYLPVVYPAIVGGMASVRECHVELCGLRADRVPRRVKNLTIERGGILVSVSSQAAPDGSFPDVSQLVKALDERVSKLAKSHGVDLSNHGSSS
jgi:hypothetical protein